MPLSAEDVVAIKELIVDPLSDKIDGLVKPLQADVEELNGRMSRAEATLRPFSKVYAAVVAVALFIGKQVWNRLRKIF